MGARSEQPTRTGVKTPSANPRRSHGGQSSLPAFFGLRIADTGSAPACTEVKAVHPAEGKTVARPQSALTFAHRRAIIRGPHPADIERRNAAMHLAAVAAAQRDERDWSGLADLAASPEWDRTLPFGSVEVALTEEGA